MKSINAKNIAAVAADAPSLLEEVARQGNKAEGLRSDAYALFASAVLVASGNETGRSKAGSAVRKSIGFDLLDDGTYSDTSRDGWSRGSQSKAEQVLAALAPNHAADGAYDAAVYAKTYDFVIENYVTIWNAYDVLFPKDEDGKDPADKLVGLLRTAAQYAKKNGILLETLEVTAAVVFAEVFGA